MVVDDREPLRIAAGDTLQFTRSLSLYDAAAGWSLHYKLTSGGGVVFTFISVASQSAHAVTVLPAATISWPPADYLLAGYAELASTGERHEIYRGTLTVESNQEVATGQEPVKTFAQKMVELLEASFLANASPEVLNTEVAGVRVGLIPADQRYNLLARFRQDRANELDMERSRNGQPSRNRIRPQFRIVSPGPVFGVRGAGVPGLYSGGDY